MKILIISHSFAPHLSPRALRWGAIAKQWTEAGHNVHVITSFYPGAPRCEEHAGMVIHRTGGKFNEALQHRLRGSLETTSRTSVGNVESARKSSIRNSIIRVIKFVYDHSWKKIYWPDYACLWIIPTVRYARRLIEEGSVDVIVTVAPPFSGHMVGLLVNKRKTDKPWLVDSGDPFCFMTDPPINNKYLYKRLNYYIESKIFSSADMISLTTEQTAQLYSKLFADTGEKIHVIPPLVNTKSLQTKNESNIQFKENRIVLVYIGSFYPGVREPDGLLSLIEAMIRQNDTLKERLELHIFGPIQNVSDNIGRYESLRGRLYLHGPTPHKQALSALFQATILINVGNKTSYQLPSKLVEYIYTGKPIINICSSKEDSSVEFLKDYPLSISVTEDNCIEKVVKFIEESIHKTVERELIEELVLPFTAEAISGQYLSLLNKLITDNEV